ncbi:MAG TPA: FG-GAP-like repeat-containing protein [Pyrinomonadaceae bacterium]|jgi:probable HAF family extracellular repeat protein
MLRLLMVLLSVPLCAALTPAQSPPRYTLTDLGTLGGNDSAARALNNAGRVAGQSYTDGFNPFSDRAFLYSDGAMRDLGRIGTQLSYVTRLSDAGQILGCANEHRTGQACHAFIYEGGALTDLNSLLPTDSGVVLVSAEDINAAGPIVGYNNVGSSFARHALMLTPSAPVAACAVPSFAGPAFFSTIAAHALAVGDLDGDGKADVAVVNAARPGSVAILRGDGGGRLTAAGTFPTGAVPLSVAIADFNGDGRADLITANSDPTDGEASVLLGNGDGSFGAPRPLHWSPGGFTRNAQVVTVADFNGDGKADVALTTNLGFVRTALGDGAGNFTNLNSVASGGTSPGHIVAADFSGDGKPDLALVNQGSGNVAVLKGDGAGAFAAPTTYAVSTSTRFLAAADFNHDNKPDLAVASQGAGVTILLNDGAGGFAPAKNFSSGGTGPYALVANDLNGDGHVDLVALNWPEGTAVVLRGSGDGEFSPVASYFVGVAGAKFFAQGDLNGDGLPDLIVAHESARGVATLLNNCGAPNPVTIRLSSNLYFMVEQFPADFYGIVLRTGPLAGSVSVDYATADGTAVSPGDYAPAAGTLTLAEGEAFKGLTVTPVSDTSDEPDESLTLTLSNPTGGAVLGSPNVAQLIITDDDPPPQLAVGDAAVTEGNAGSVSAVFTVSLSAPSGFAVTVNYATADGAAAAGADYDAATGTLTFAPGELTKTVAVSVRGDTLAEVNEHFFVNLSGPANATLADAQGVGTIRDDDSACPAPGFTPAADLSVGTTPFAVVARDFNGDGRADLATANFGSNNVSLLLAGAGGFGAPANFPVNGAPRALAVADFDLDGKLDIATANGGDAAANSVSLLLGNGAGGFAAATNVNAGALAYYVVAADFNLDNKPDLAAVNISPGTVSLLLGDGHGGFGARATFPVGTSPEYAVAGDFNRDGKPDLAVSNLNSHNVSLLVGDGAGGFAAATNFAVGQNPQGLAAGDLDGDGKLDLAVANSGANSVSLLLGDGAGGFAAATNLAVGSRPTFVAAADLNGDQLLDLVTANYQTNDPATGDLSVLFGAGAGRFALPVSVPVRQNPVALAVSDLDADGAADIVAVNLRSNSLSLLLNACSASPARPVLQFAAAGYTVAEGAGRATLTVTRTGDTSTAATVEYRTQDADTFTVGCFDQTNNHGGAYARCDFATVVGSLSFAAGESSKQITVPVIDDGHAEGVETFQVVLSNAGGATLGTPATATVTITDNDAAGAPNPIITTGPALYPFFVRQQYLDFLSREPEAGEPWTGVMNRCANVNTGPEVNTDCDRIAVSGAFFGSPEFQLKGFYVFRFYRLAFNRLPAYPEITADMSFVAGATPQEVFARKAQLATNFTQRQEFQALYGGLSDAAYVNALVGRYQLTQITTPDPQNPDGTTKVTLTSGQLLSQLGNNTLTRAQVLRAVADSDQVNAAEFNNAFVGMQYYGYLRRAPEAAGYEANLAALRRGVSFREIINAFLNSAEYRLRFGSTGQ